MSDNTNATSTPNEMPTFNEADIAAMMKAADAMLDTADSDAPVQKNSRATAMTDTVFHQNGTMFLVQPRGNPPQPLEVLPPGNYVVKFNPMMGYYLEMVSNFPPIKKVYGDANTTANRILNTYKAKNGNLGVLLDGIKGSGKTLTARLISMKAAKMGIPTLIINSPFSGEDFFLFLYSIQQECVILFDEFEKVYDDKKQEGLLTVLDGTFPSKKLFLLTSNDKSKINTHLKNRPGRIHYYLNFKGLSGDFIREYVEDVLENKDHAPELLSICGMFSALNFDSLHSLVWEMNLYNEPAGKAISMLNTRPEDGRDIFQVEMTIKGIPYVFKGSMLSDDSVSGNPLSMSVTHIAPRVPLQLQMAAQLLNLPEERVLRLNPAGFEETKALIESVKKEDPNKRVNWADHNYYSGYSYANGVSIPCMVVSPEDGSFIFGPQDLKEINVEDKSFKFVNASGTTLRLVRKVEPNREMSHYASLVA